MARRKTWMKFIVAMAIVAVGSVAFGTLSTPSASGVTTTVTIAPRFFGLVNAAEQCQAGRKIIVKRFRRKEEPKKIGTTTSDASGNWELPTTQRFGRYYAVAEESPGSGTGYGSVTCEKGRSPLLNLGRRPR